MKLKIKIMSYELVGKLIAKFDTVQVTATFKKREFAIEKTDDIGERTIVNYAKFQCVQDKTEMLEKVNIGDEVKVYFNIRGNKWEKDGKTNYITNLDAWRIEQILNPNQVQNNNPKNDLEPLDNFTSEEVADDLPF